MTIPLQNNLQCEQLCRIIQKEINKFTRDNPDLKDLGLSISIVQIQNGGDKHIPKLEYKPM